MGEVRRSSEGRAEIDLTFQGRGLNQALSVRVVCAVLPPSGGIRFARFGLMDSKVRNPSANVPAQTDEDPKGDRGQGDKTWTAPVDEQGISNRAGDESEFVEGSTGQPRPLGRDEIIEDSRTAGDPDSRARRQ